jgi:hypothetical protein
MTKTSAPYPLPPERGGQDLWAQSTSGRCHLVVRGQGGNIAEADSWVTPAGEEVNHRAIIIAVACTIGSVGFYDYHKPVFVWQIRGHLPQQLPNGHEAEACANCAQIARTR